MSFYGHGQEMDLVEDAMQSAGMAWWLMELPSGAVFFSPEKTKMLGYTDTEKFIHYKDFMRLVHPDDQKIAMDAMYDLIEGRKDVYETSYRIQCHDGAYKTFYDRGKVTARKGREIAVTGVVVDADRWKLL